ncbi:tail fiber protein [Alisedimentitalea sp. MJ-SS2]|uniref:phage tail protein n=1 Tax=Aliisedimentitalea sp. MJ-SS2 TaxID=3049795 RepID=UPI002915A1C3|nr:tail fiber protein [Alisedimentitalea sp. MJ-SS2]MDU8930046.1 tail fiber protein [Alisedimentitalea sp. MJ-SS2]
MKNALKTTAAISALCLSGAMAPSGATAGDQPYVGEMMVFAGNFCPRDWAAAGGQLLAISSNQALFSLLGTYYGGDGRTTFGLPDLRGRAPIHYGRGAGLPAYVIGERGGVEAVTLTTNNLASHNHQVHATNAQGNKLGPGTDLLADPNTGDPNTEVQIYSDKPANVTMSPNMIQNTGSSVATNVESPYLGLQICIALYGIYPSRN